MPAARAHAAAIGPHGHVRRQGLHEGIEITTHDGGEEPLGDLLADLRIGPVAGTAGVHVLACAVSELADRRRAAVQDAGDLGGMVLDPFCGTGTTGIAALALGRQFTGIELSPAFAALAAERLRHAAQPDPDGGSR